MGKPILPYNLDPAAYVAPASSMIVTGTKYPDYHPYGIDRGLVYGLNQDDLRDYNQGPGESAIKGLTNVVTGFVGGILSIVPTVIGFGYHENMAQLSALFGVKNPDKNTLSEDVFHNPLANGLQSLQDAVKFTLYKDSKAGTRNFFQELGDDAYLFGDFADGVATFASFFAEGAGIAKVLGETSAYAKLATTLNEIVNGSKEAKLLKTSLGVVEDAERAAGNAEKVNKLKQAFEWTKKGFANEANVAKQLNTFTISAVNRVLESTMEGQDTYNRLYKSKFDQAITPIGMKSEDGKDGMGLNSKQADAYAQGLADKAAKSTFVKNLPLVLLDYLEFHNIFGGIANAKSSRKAFLDAFDKSVAAKEAESAAAGVAGAEGSTFQNVKNKIVKGGESVSKMITKEKLRSAKNKFIKGFLLEGAIEENIQQVIQDWSYGHYDGSEKEGFGAYASKQFFKNFVTKEGWDAIGPGGIIGGVAGGLMGGIEHSHELKRMSAMGTIVRQTHDEFIRQFAQPDSFFVKDDNNELVLKDGKPVINEQAMDDHIKHITTLHGLSQLRGIAALKNDTVMHDMLKNMQLADMALYYFQGGFADEFHGKIKDWGKMTPEQLARTGITFLEQDKLGMPLTPKQISEKYGKVAKTLEVIYNNIQEKFTDVDKDLKSEDFRRSLMYRAAASIYSMKEMHSELSKDIQQRQAAAGIGIDGTYDADRHINSLLDEYHSMKDIHQADDDALDMVGEKTKEYQSSLGKRLAELEDQIDSLKKAHPRTDGKDDSLEKLRTEKRDEMTVNSLGQLEQNDIQKRTSDRERLAVAMSGQSEEFDKLSNQNRYNQFKQKIKEEALKKEELTKAVTEESIKKYVENIPYYKEAIEGKDKSKLKDAIDRLEASIPNQKEEEKPVIEKLIKNLKDRLQSVTKEEEAGKVNANKTEVEEVKQQADNEEMEQEIVSNQTDAPGADSEWEYSGMDPLQAKVEAAEHDMDAYPLGSWMSQRAAEVLIAAKSNPIGLLQSDLNFWSNRQPDENWSQDEIDRIVRDLNKKISQLKASTIDTTASSVNNTAEQSKQETKAPDDLQPKKADIERRRQEELNKKPNTPEGFNNRLFDSNIQLGEFNGNGHLSEEGYNYRVLSQAEINAILESGGVYPREGKQKGGNTNTKYWTKGNNKNWYGDKENLETIRVKSENFKENEVVSAKDIEVYNKETGKFESLSDKINAKYDAKYIDKVKKGEFTKQQAKDALKEIGRLTPELEKQIDGVTNNSGTNEEANVINLQLDTTESDIAVLEQEKKEALDKLEDSITEENEKSDAGSTLESKIATQKEIDEKIEEASAKIEKLLSDIAQASDEHQKLIDKILEEESMSKKETEVANEEKDGDETVKSYVERSFRQYLKGLYKGGLKDFFKRVKDKVRKALLALSVSSIMITSVTGNLGINGYINLAKNYSERHLEVKPDQKFQTVTVIKSDNGLEDNMGVNKVPYKTGYVTNQIINLSTSKFEARNREDKTPVQNAVGITTNLFKPFQEVADFKGELPRRDEATKLNPPVIAFNKNTGEIKAGNLKNFDKNWQVSETFTIPLDFKLDADGKVATVYHGQAMRNVPVSTVNGKVIPFPIGLDTKDKSIDPTTHNTFGVLEGGKVILSVGDYQVQVNGGFADIYEAWKLLKEKNPNKEITAYLLDNGSYNLPILKNDGVVTAEDLTAHTLRNKDGGTSLILKQNVPQEAANYPNGYQKIETNNYRKDSTGAKVENHPTVIVLHHTGEYKGGEKDVINAFIAPKGNSSHYLIGKDGKIYQFNDGSYVMSHAGKSIFNGREDVNAFSIGIEIQGDSRENDFTKKQYESLIALVNQVAKTYNIPIDSIVDHETIRYNYLKNHPEDKITQPKFDLSDNVMSNIVTQLRKNYPKIEKQERAAHDTTKQNDTHKELPLSSPLEVLAGLQGLDLAIREYRRRKGKKGTNKKTSTVEEESSATRKLIDKTTLQPIIDKIEELKLALKEQSKELEQLKEDKEFNTSDIIKLQSRIEELTQKANEIVKKNRENERKRSKIQSEFDNKISALKDKQRQLANSEEREQSPVTTTSLPPVESLDSHVEGKKEEDTFVGQSMEGIDTLMDEMNGYGVSNAGDSLTDLTDDLEEGCEPKI